MSDKDLFDNRDDLFGEDGDEFGFDDGQRERLGDLNATRRSSAKKKPSAKARRPAVSGAACFGLTAVSS
jgi:hypothetical protein